jgi:hypothetical protein
MNPDLTSDKWRARIQACVLQDEVMLTVAAYLGTWRPQDVTRLPVALTCRIQSPTELQHRALDLAVAEVTFKGSNSDWKLLRELAQVVTTAAARAHQLNSAPVH